MTTIKQLNDRKKLLPKPQRLIPITSEQKHAANFEMEKFAIVAMARDSLDVERACKMVDELIEREVTRRVARELARLDKASKKKERPSDTASD